MNVKYKVVKGDLLKLARADMFDIVLHGCNCFQAMGGGIAYQIKNEYPQAKFADDLTVYGDISKLGTFSSSLGSKDNGGKFVILNCYTQDNMSGGEDVFSYKTFMPLLNNIAKLYKGKRIGYPMIGAGLARGDWDYISRTICLAFDGKVDHTLVVYDPDA